MCIASSIFSLNPDLQTGHTYHCIAEVVLRWRIECVHILNNCLLYMIDNPDLLVLRKRELVALLIISLSSDIYSRGGFTSEWNFFVARYLFYSALGFSLKFNSFPPLLIVCVHITKGVETSNNGHILPELQFHDILTKCFPILRILGCHPTWIAWFAFLHFQNCRNKMIQFQPAYSLALCACVLLLSQKALPRGRQRSLSSQHTWTFLQP